MIIEQEASLIKTIDSELVTQLRETNKPVLYKKETTIIYKDHIPIVAYLILEGQVAIMKKNKIQQVCEANQIIGLHQLIHHEKSEYSVVTYPNCKLIFLDKSYLIATDHKQLKS